MNAPLRKVGVVVIVLFALLFANLNWVQGYKADSYRTNKYNGRVQIANYQRQRGTIYDDKGNALATSVATTGSLKYLRTYPGGPAFEPIMGYKPVNLAATGIESAMDTYLAGDASDNLRISDLFTARDNPGDDVYLTLDKKIQDEAYKELENNGQYGDTGSVVVMNPNTGAILAMVSTPSYDPTDLASHTGTVARAAYDKYNNDPTQPLVNKATQTTWPPGSTFKVVVSSAALASGSYTPDTVIPAGQNYQPVPGSSYVMHNAEDDTCPSATMNLLEALTVSCNTAYGQLGVALGAKALQDQATAYGFGDKSLTIAGSGNTAIPVAPSLVGDMSNGSGQDDKNLVAQSSIGQYDDRMTPLMGCMIASAVATGGTEMRPYLVDHVRTPTLQNSVVAQPSQLRQPISQSVAGNLQTMMFSVVQNGTGKGAGVDGYQVGGKTGTAQNGNDANGNALLTHRWFIGFAMKDGKPLLAIAVFLKNAGSKGKQAPPALAGDILKVALQELGGS